MVYLNWTASRREYISDLRSSSGMMDWWLCQNVWKRKREWLGVYLSLWGNTMQIINKIKIRLYIKWIQEIHLRQQDGVIQYCESSCLNMRDLKGHTPFIVTDGQKHHASFTVTDRPKGHASLIAPETEAPPLLLWLKDRPHLLQCDRQRIRHLWVGLTNKGHASFTVSNRHKGHASFTESNMHKGHASFNDGCASYLRSNVQFSNLLKKLFV